MHLAATFGTLRKMASITGATPSEGDAMDREEFDTFARIVARRGDRRSTLLGALGLAFAAPDAPAMAAKRGKARGRGVGKQGKGGNSACAHFCAAVFPPGRRRGRCVSEGATRAPGNLCEACEADVSRFCAGACCAPGETCDGTTCHAACAGTWEACEGDGASCAACGEDEICPDDGAGCAACATSSGGTVCDGVFGPNGTTPETQCGPGGTFSCSCAERSDETGSVCTGNVVGCSEVAPTCATDLDCEVLFPDAGFVCVRKGSCPAVDDCVGENVCVVPCDFTASVARGAGQRGTRIVFAN
jgi:hypothetical protein